MKAGFQISFLIHELGCSPAALDSRLRGNDVGVFGARPVIPAKTGVQISHAYTGLHAPWDALDSRLRGNDVWAFVVRPVIPASRHPPSS